MRRPSAPACRASCKSRSRRLRSSTVRRSCRGLCFEHTTECSDQLLDRLCKWLVMLAGRERSEDLRVVLVVDDDVLFGREVIEKRAFRDVGRGGDLLDGRLFVALTLEETQCRPLDRRLGFLFLALA